MSESLDEVVGGVGDLLRRDGLENGQKLFERDSVVVLLALDELSDVGLGRVRAEGTENLADLLGLLDIICYVLAR